MVESIWQDVRHGLRLLWTTPTVSVAAVSSLALGIGASIAMFIIVNAALLRPLPARAPEELVLLFAGPRERPYQLISYPDYLDYRDASDVFHGLAAFGEVAVSLSDSETPELAHGLIATGNFFEVLGVGAGLGRTFTAEDDRIPGERPVIVLSYGLWRRRFGSDPTIVGRTVAVNGRPYTVLGVTAAGFRGPLVLESYDFYVPMMMQAEIRPPRAGFAGEMNPDLLKRRNASWLQVVGRLAPGVSIEEAEASVATLSRRLAEAYPDTNAGETATLFPLRHIDPRGYPVLRSVAILLMAVAALVLLIATANVTSLLLARAIARKREIGIRLSLGGSRSRLVRQLLTESLLLGAMGGALGLLVASWALAGLSRLVPANGAFAFSLDYEVDARVLAFAALASIVSALLVGIPPALQGSRSDLVRALRGSSGEGGRDGSRVTGRNALVVAQISLSIVLLVGAGLFLKSFWRSSAVSPGFDADRVLASELSIDVLRYTKAQGREFYRAVVERMEGVPNVESASLARIAPLSGARTTSLWVEDLPPEPAGRELEIATNVVGLDYFRTLGIGLVAGRDFSPGDVEGSPGVVIANESFVARYFPLGSALGKRVRLNRSEEEWREIVGIVRDSKYRFLGEDATPFLYQPLGQQHETGMTLLVRTRGAPVQSAADVRREILSLEPNLPAAVQPLSSLIADSLFPVRMAARLLTVFAALAVFLAALGLYGVMSFAVSRRTREMGIRVALGARPEALVGLVLAEGLLLVAVGISIGWAAALAGARLLESFLYGVSPTDAETFLAVSFLLALVMLATTYFPARRAARSNPLKVLRHE